MKKTRFGGVLSAGTSLRNNDSQDPALGGVRSTCEATQSGLDSEVGGCVVSSSRIRSFLNTCLLSGRMTARS